MAQEFRLPELGENVTSGDLVRVMVKPGDSVSEGQPVIEIETDKAVIEVPSPVSGKVHDIRAKQGERVKVGQVIFTFESTNGKTPAPSAQNVQSAPPPSTDTKPAVAPKQELVKPSATPAAVAVPPNTGPVHRMEFKLPELGENVLSGQLVRIIAKEGATVSEGQPVLELETDKAVIEVPATFNGTIREVRAKEGDKVSVGQLIFIVDAPTGGSQPAPAVQVSAAPASPSKEHHDGAPSGAQLARWEFVHALRSEGKTEREAHPPDALQLVRTAYEPLTPGRPTIPASPTVRRLAREIGVNIQQVKGSGPGGRISESDVKAHAKQLLLGRSAAAPARVAPALPDFSKWGAIEKEQMRSVRRKTAEHLANAWTTIPHVTQHDKADITEMEKVRASHAKQAEAAGGKLTPTAIVLKIVAEAMKRYPKFNASIDVEHEEIIHKKYVHIGIAVDTDRGLLVPVIRDVDQKSVYQLAAELTQISAKARDKKLSPQDMEGGTFTITNLGGIGGTMFTPIVNYPEVAILGMSRSRIEPVWNGQQFEPRTILPLSLSYDHRLIDGADAARYLRFICDALEHPNSLFE